MNKIKQYILDGLSATYLVFVVLFFITNTKNEQSVDLSAKFLLFFIFFLFGILMSSCFDKKNITTLGSYLFFKKNSSQNKKIFFKNFWFWHFFVLMVTLFIIGFYKTKISITELFNEDGFNGMKRLFSGIFSPNWQILPQAVLNIIETLFMAFMATMLAVPFAFLLSFLSAKNRVVGKISYITYFSTRTLFNFARSIEVLLWAIIFSVWVGIGPFAGMLALMIHSIASLAKQFSEMIESADQGLIEAITSTGANRIQILWFGVLPQVILPFISFTIYRLDINVRMATIVGLVGGGGIGTMLIQYQGQGMWAEVGTIIIVIAIVVWLIDIFSAYLREALK